MNLLPIDAEVFKMFLNKLFQFLKGYVILLLSGRETGRFINICIKRKIRLDSIHKLPDGSISVCVFAKDFKKLIPIAYKTGVLVHIKRKCGLWHTINKYKHRVFYVTGALFFLFIITVATRFIWSIDVVGASTEECKNILAAAELAGIKIGAFKDFLPEGNEIKNIILSNTDNITWAWVYLKGTKAVIEVREGTKPPEIIDKNLPCNIISGRDGIITGITVKRGVAAVGKGDVVLKGDLLICGEKELPDAKIKRERAAGDVYAATWHTKKASIKLFREVRKETGRTKRFFDIQFFGKNIALYKKVNVPFENYSIKVKKRELKWGRNGYIGVGFCQTVYAEEAIERIPQNKDAAVESAKYELEEEIAKELLPFSKLESEDIQYTQKDSETVEVTLTMQFTEKIGLVAPIQDTYRE